MLTTLEKIEKYLMVFGMMLNNEVFYRIIVCINMYYIVQIILKNDT